MVNVHNYYSPEDSNEPKKVKNCIRCGKEFTYKSPVKKFCNTQCTTRYGSKVLWERKKNDVAYKKKKNEARIAWGKRNKKKESAYVSKWLIKRANERKKNKLCVRCGKVDVSKENFKNCAPCREQKRLSMLKTQQKKKKEAKLKESSN